MLFREEILESIAAGRVSVTFRRQVPGEVRPGQTFVTRLGTLTVGVVKPVDAETIREADARRAGYATRALLLAELEDTSLGQVFRIELAFRPLG